MVPLSDIGSGRGCDVEDLDPVNRWYVGPQWLEDSSLFNEWMSEEDYETKQV